jgi:4-diphosphocytidyl-2-C-methyl-D-erythritol kinase
MRITAYAKINWDLLVLGKRPDGFHEVDTVMVRVGLADELTIEPCENLILTSSDPTLPCDDTNLICRAARGLAAAASVTAGARMHVQKRIPSGGGMGGGSADAAATLVALNRLWHLAWPIERLAPIAAELGSDVAFFLQGGWCRCRGRGEVVEPLPELNRLPPIRIWLIIPPCRVPTPSVFRTLDADPWTQTQQHRILTKLQEQITVRIQELVNQKECKWLLANNLLPASQKVEPRLRDLAKHLEQLFPGRWQMSGSGAVHFVIPHRNMRLEGFEPELRRRWGDSLIVIETATHAS